jgi:hypothetical protein
VLQAFNLAIPSLALVSHAFSGLLTRQVGWVTLIAVRLYRRMGDRNYHRIVMILLMISGLSLILTSL